MSQFKIHSKHDVHISQIYWPLERNVRDDMDYGSEAKRAELIQTLKFGWNPLKATLIEVAVPPDELLAKLNARREADWAKYQKDAKTSAVEAVRLLEAFEFYYVQGGKVKPVDFVGNMGFRRSTCFLPAYVAAKYPTEGLQKNAGAESLIPPAFDNIGIIVAEFLTDVELHMQQLRENVGTKQGKQDLSDNTYAKVALEMWNDGAKQAQFREVMGDGSGQKWWEIASLSHDARYITNQLHQRCLEGIERFREIEQANKDLSEGETKLPRKLTYVIGGPVDPAKFAPGPLRNFRTADEDGKVKVGQDSYTADDEGLEGFIGKSMTGKRGLATKIDKTIVEAGVRRNIAIVRDVAVGISNGTTDVYKTLESKPLFISLMNSAYLFFSLGDDALKEACHNLNRIYEEHTGKDGEKAALHMTAHNAKSLVMSPMPTAEEPDSELEPEELQEASHGPVAEEAPEEASHEAPVAEEKKGRRRK